MSLHTILRAVPNPGLNSPPAEYHSSTIPTPELLVVGVIVGSVMLIIAIIAFALRSRETLPLMSLPILLGYMVLLSTLWFTGGATNPSYTRYESNYKTSVRTWLRDDYGIDASKAGVVSLLAGHVSVASTTDGPSEIELKHTVRSGLAVVTPHGKVIRSLD